MGVSRRNVPIRKSMVVSLWQGRRGRSDMASLVSSGTIAKTRKKRAGITDDVLRVIVRYILQNNTVVLSMCST